MNIQEEIEKTKKAHEELGKRIRDLEAQAKKPKAPAPQSGEIWADGNGDLMIIGQKSLVYLKNGVEWTIERHPHWGEHKQLFNRYVGKFEDLFFTREQLKEKFLKMRDKYDHTAASCVNLDYVFTISDPMSFIDNLLDDKDCD